jgi:hypothetical protein
MSLFETIPSSLFYILQSFLTRHDYHKIFTVSASSFLQGVKRETGYFSLNEETSLHYLKDPAFRALVNAGVVNKSKQVSLSFDWSGAGFSPRHVAFLKGVHSCKLKNINSKALKLLSVSSKKTDLSAFSDINTLYLVCDWDGKPEESLSSTRGLCNVSSLSLVGFNGLMDVSNLVSLSFLKLCNCDSISDVSSLGNIHTLALVSCPNIEDISGLGNHHELYLVNLPLVSEVNHLGKVHQLVLEDCPLVNDVSRLGAVSILKIACCEQVINVDDLTQNDNVVLEGLDGIRDFASLANVRTVGFINCQIKDISVFRSLVSLHLHGCYQVKNISCLAALSSTLQFFILEYSEVSDITMLGFLKKIVVFNNNKIKSVQGLGQIRSVTLISCSNLSSLKGLGRGNHHVYIGGTDRIKDFSPLKNCFKVVIDRCPSFTKAKDLENVNTLCIKRTCSLKDVSPLFKVQMLVLVKVNIKKICGLHDVPVVHLVECWKIDDISGLGNNRSVLLNNLWDLESVESLSKVPDVRIVRCDMLRDLRPLKLCERVEWTGSRGQKKPFYTVPSAHYAGRLPLLSNIRTREPINYEELFGEDFREDEEDEADYDNAEDWGTFGDEEEEGWEIIEDED